MDGQYFFIHSSVDGHCGCFHIGAVMNPVNIRVQDSVRTHAVSSWSGGAESHCNSCDFLFTFCGTARLFQRGCTICNPTSNVELYIF